MSDPFPKSDALTPKIIFEDTHLVVISKPAGLLSQGESTGETNLVEWCREYFGRNYVGLVHRLDRGTSGLMVVAKRSKAAERLTDALQKGLLIRNYRALLEGDLAAPAEWTHWLKKNEATNTSATVRAGTPGAKEAKLRVSPREFYTDPSGRIFTLAEFELETGRSHQIRVQASAMRFPLVGDAKYGGKSGDSDFAKSPGLNRPALHSFYLRFPHPMTHETTEYRDELADDLRRFLNRLKKRK